MRKAIRDASAVTIANGLSALLGAIAVVFTIRSLPVAQWTVAAIIISVGPFVSLCLSLGTVTHGVRELAREPSGEARCDRFAVFMGRRVSLALIVCTAGVVLSISGAEVAGLCLVLASARFFRGGTTVLLSAERRFIGQSAVIVGEKLVTVVSVIILLKLDASFASLPSAQVLGAIVAGVGALLIKRDWARWKAFLSGLKGPLRMWRGSGYFGVASLSTAAQQLDVSIVAAVASTYQTGLFAAAARIPSSLNILGSALALVIMPNAANSGTNLGRLARVHQRRAWAALVGLTCVVTGATYSAAWWVPLLLGSQYEAAVPVVRVYLVAVMVAILIQPAVALLQARGLDKYAARISALQVALALASQALGAAIAGALGAAVGLLLASGLAATLLLNRLRSLA